MAEAAGVAAPESTEPNVQGQLGRLTGAIERLEHQWGRLASRVDVVLGPYEPQPSGPDVAMAEPALSEIASRIQALRARVDQIVDAIINAVDRIEV